jgi:hypothetical protein
MITQYQRGVDTTAELWTPHAPMPVGPSASRLAIQPDILSLGAKTSKTSQFAVIRFSTGIESRTSESYFRSYKVASSCVNRCAWRLPDSEQRCRRELGCDQMMTLFSVTM